MWVADDLDDKIYAYTLATKARDASKDFDTLDAAGNTDPAGIWSDGAIMWVADHVDDKLYAYNLATKARDASKDFDTLDAAGNGAPRGIWSDGTTMWVADSANDKLYAYNLATKARDSSKDFNTLSSAGNNFPVGAWSDGYTMWVADYLDDKLYAYYMGTKARFPGRDFNTLGLDDDAGPTAIWSDGTTMWVAAQDRQGTSDLNDDTARISAYNMSENPAKDSSLYHANLSGVSYEPRFIDPEITMYQARAPYRTSATEVRVWPAFDKARYLVKVNRVPVKNKDKYEDVPLPAGQTTTITIEVISADGSSRTEYQFAVFRELSNDTRLSKLELTRGSTTLALDPDFSAKWHRAKNQPRVLRYGVTIESAGAVDLDLKAQPRRDDARINAIRSGDSELSGSANPGQEVTHGSIRLPAGRVTRLEIDVEAASGALHTHEVYVHVRRPSADSDVVVQTFDRANGTGKTWYVKWHDIRTCNRGRRLLGRRLLPVGHRGRAGGRLGL